MSSNHLYNNNNGSIFGAVDWITIFTYLTLVLLGWMSIYAAVYNEDHSSMFDMSQKYGSQIFWIGICCLCGVAILLIDSKYYHYLSYHGYIFMVLVLICVLLFGREVNGARSWFQVGSFRIQPAEFAKVTTALALAKYMSSYSFDIKKFRSISVVMLLISLPAGVILIQNDTGSALVFASFFVMLYREGFNGWAYVVIILMILIFVLSFVLEPLVILLILTFSMMAIEGLMNGNWDTKIRFGALVLLVFVCLWLTLRLLFSVELEVEYIYIISLFCCSFLIGIYIVKNQLLNVFVPIVIFGSSVLYLFSVDYVFDNLMQIHQQKRVLDLLGLESDVKNWGYNVNQSKIAIGSGGFSGKGFLKGTQTKYDFVPEQSTDFIYCTISEEWGFLGSAIVVILFTVLIIRLMKMGDRQNDAFGRIYCYCAASVFAFHVLINIGMTIGLMPVIGIPLPFFSYGGSSLLAFTILLFVALRLDSARNDSQRGVY